MSRRLQQIKSGVFSRGLALARVSASASARAAGHVLGNLFSTEEDRAESLKALILNQVQALTLELGELKGSLMKVGQMLSMYGEHLFPPEINAILKSLQSQSPPLDWKALEPVLKRGLGEKLGRLEIDPEPLASASLGQVHRATIRETGERIVLKIQYPGVDRAIDSDLRALRRILSVSKLLPTAPGKGTDDLFREVRQMLHQEVDFCRELIATNRFREFLRDDPRLLVARTFPEFSSPRVIATEYLEGVAVDGPEVRALTQERRNDLGLAALELFFRELFVLGAVQTDPHFGNYRVRLGDPARGTPDRLILLDFGAVRDFPARFLRPYYRMGLGAIRRDPAQIARAAEELEFLRPEDTPEQRAQFAEVCFFFAEPFLPGSEAGRVPDGLLSADGIYDWGRSDLPRRAAVAGAKLAFAMKLRPPPREVVFLDRKLGGIFIFLSTIGARVRARELLERYLVQADNPNK